MRKNTNIYIYVLRICLPVVLISVASIHLYGQEKEHPTLIIPREAVVEMQESVDSYPLWGVTVNDYLKSADEIIEMPIDVPIPKDPAGGYTHSQHKLNGKALRQTGNAYLVSGDEKYASYAKELFLAYADKYSEFGQHPVKKSYAPGKLFWQQLNEAVWLVDAIQGYDAIYDFLSNKERKKIESDLLRPFADFLSIENGHVFNRLHNHGVWAVAAVGMTGLAIGDDELVFRALYGIDEQGKPFKESYVKPEITSLDAGFFVQTLSLFSPDGYYTEGPYYQRYAMTPFLLFAQSLDNNVPEVEIMKFGNGIFIKAVEILIDLAAADGRYFAINDNLKGMSLYSPGSVAALCFLYAKTADPSILDILEEVPLSTINTNSLKVVQDLSSNKKEDLRRKSKLIRDGKNGNEGGIALIRDVKDAFCVVLKYASHGLSHGHYDRLNIFYYNKANEILTDYGSVRYVNVQAKEGGRYLPENTSYAKQSVAHNTLVVDQVSHFGSEYTEAQECHAELVYDDLEDVSKQFVCAKEVNAYPGVEMLRVTGLITDDDFINPVLLDVFVVKSDKEHETYDMPYHFKGNIINTGFEYRAFPEQQTALGEAYGYQHLWKIAEGKPKSSMAGLSWLDNTIIHTLNLAVNEDSELILSRTGAGDPNFNMRSEPVLILRERKKSDHVFASLLETHGNQDESTEFVSNQDPSIQDIQVVQNDPGYIAVAFETRKSSFLFLSVTEVGQENVEHVLSIDGEEYKWVGNNTIIKTIEQ